MQEYLAPGEGLRSYITNSEINLKVHNYRKGVCLILERAVDY